MSVYVFDNKIYGDKINVIKDIIQYLFDTGQFSDINDCNNKIGFEVLFPNTTKAYKPFRCVKISETIWGYIHQDTHSYINEQTNQWNEFTDHLKKIGLAVITTDDGKEGRIIWEG